MHQHGPDELLGPVRGTPSWWRGLGAPPVEVYEGAAETPKPAKKRRYANDPHVRHDLVERVRGEIEAGTYDTPEKWQAVLDRLLDRIDED